MTTSLFMPLKIILLSWRLRGVLFFLFHSSRKGAPLTLQTVCIHFYPMREREKRDEKIWLHGKRSDDITGSLMCVRVEVLTSTVTGRGRASIPYVGHIKNTCSDHKFSQLTDHPAKQHWNHNCKCSSSTPWQWKSKRSTSFSQQLCKVKYTEIHMC